jgi:hypothetical protein
MNTKVLKDINLEVVEEVAVAILTGMIVVSVPVLAIFG